MFYNNQTLESRNKYKKSLSHLASLSKLFSDSDKPMIYYRAHENCFCICFEAENLARHDCSADAKKDNIGIGLKTWIGSNNQKIAEFGKLRKKIEGLNNKELIIKISEFRNERIKTTKNMYNINNMEYHIVKRESNKILLAEFPYDYIDIDNIKELPEKNGINTCYFTDRKHTYNYNKSKTTLYMIFDDLKIVDEIPVEINDEPFYLLEEMEEYLANKESKTIKKLCLKLYSENKKNGCFIPEKSGLNQWNASGRKRDPNEIYIPFPKKDRVRKENINFFPPRDKNFNLILPDGKKLTAKICQADGKAIMSNPNKDLGKWLLRDVLEFKESTLVNYNTLVQKGFDAVIFEKINNETFKIDFTDSSVYEQMYNETKYSR